MTATLFGIYNAQRSLSLNQAVIDLVNNNIANINTPGYSKQRAELEQLTSGNISTIAQNACQDVMGAIISDITRNREAYLDNYYRSECSQYNYYNELNENANLIEDITGELDNIGINHSLDEFYEALNHLAANPTDIVARNNVVQKGIELTTKLNSTYSRLENLRTNLVGDFTIPSTLENSKLSIAIQEVNNKLSSIADLNDSIILSTSQGSSPNYLLDQRDLLLDDLSELIPVEITHHENGSATISLGTTTLVSGGSQVGFFEVAVGDIDTPSIVQIKNATGGTFVTDAYSVIDAGKVGAILEMGGSETNKLTVKLAMDNLDTLAQEVATAFNALQTFDPLAPPAAGDEPRYMIGDQLSDFTSGDTEPPAFFVDDAGTTLNITAENISISQDIIDDPYKISAAKGSTEITDTGDGANALLMAQVRDTIIAGLGNATTEQYIANMVGDMGSKAATIENNLDIKKNVADQIHLKRESVIGVNLDEEMTDLIRFQRSYEAAARVFNVVNQNIQTILNMVS